MTPNSSATLLRNSTVVSRSSDVQAKRQCWGLAVSLLAI